jgi:pimeloyl-ACP methyl ester carboxylesterase
MADGGPVSEVLTLPTGIAMRVVRWEPADGAASGAPPLVLVHGLASNARLWDGVGRRLAAAGRRVVAVDQRGHGLSSKPDSTYSMSEVVDDLAACIEVLGWESPVLVGQSWGGNVVLETAARHPGLASTVACVDGGFIRLRERFPEWDDCARALAPPRLAGTPLRTMREWVERSAGDWPEEGRAGTLANFEVRPDGTIAPWLTFERHIAVLRGLWEHDPHDRIRAVSVPVHLLVADTGEVAWTTSKRDAVAAMSEQADAVGAGPVVVHWFSPAHHDVHAQQPDAVAAVLVGL